MQLSILTLIPAALALAIQTSDTSQASVPQLETEQLQSGPSGLRSFEEFGPMVDKLDKEIDSLLDSENLDLSRYHQVENEYRNLNESLSSFALSEHELWIFNHHYGQVIEYPFHRLNAKAASLCEESDSDDSLCTHFTFAKYADDVKKFVRAVKGNSRAVEIFDDLREVQKKDVSEDLTAAMALLDELYSSDLSQWRDEPTFDTVANQLSKYENELSDYHKKLSSRGFAF